MHKFHRIPKISTLVLLSFSACDSSDVNGGDAGPDAAVGVVSDAGRGETPARDAATDAAGGDEETLDAALDPGDAAGDAAVSDAEGPLLPETGTADADALSTGADSSAPAGFDGSVGVLPDGGDSGVFPDVEPGVLFEDDFDTETLVTNGEYTFNYTEFAQWDVTAGTVDVLVIPNQYMPEDPGGYGPGQPAEAVTVDLNGSNTRRGTIETKRAFTFYAGVSYRLEYAYGSPFEESNAARVEIEGVFSKEESQTGIAPFQTYSETFSPDVTTTAKLRFSGLGEDDNVGLFLDRIVLTRLP